MEITHENNGEKQAVIKITVPPEDYEPQVNETLKEYGKDADIKGFRKGKVPLNILKKMYGKQVFFQKINEILQGALEDYIKEEDLDLIGDPLLKEESLKGFDYENADELTVEYEVGFAPDFEVNFPEGPFERYKIQIDEETLDEHIERLRRDKGELKETDELDEDGYIEGEFKELTDEGVVLIGGKTSTATIPLKSIKKDSTKKRLQKLKEGDTTKLDIFNTFDVEEERIAQDIFDISLQELKQTSGRFQLKVHRILELQKSELNQEFFDEVLGEGKAENEEEFREVYRGQIEDYYQQMANDRVFYDFMEELKEKNDITLPNDFLKTWLKRNAQHKEDVTEQVIEREYDSYAEGTKHKLLTDKILEENGIKIESEEVEEYIKSYIRQQLQSYMGTPEVEEGIVDEQAQRMMQDQQFVNRTVENLRKEKLMDYFMKNYDMNDKEVSLDEFIEISEKEKEETASQQVTQ